MEPYLGEIRMFAGNFAPVGWALCDGSLLSISENQALFALIGTTYGGDGQTTFALPDLRGRVVMHVGNNHALGERSGSETVTLLTNQMPAHTHAAYAASTDGTVSAPTNAFWAGVTTTPFVSQATGAVTMNPQALSAAGGNQPHDNMMPYLAINYIIATEGLYPSFN